MRKRNNDLTEFVKRHLRRSSYRWGPRSTVFKASRRSRGVYECAKCLGLFGRREIRMDHVNPVIDPKKGWQGWDEYINRMFPDEKGFQALCNECHNTKTQKENEVRRKVKKNGIKTKT